MLKVNWDPKKKKKQVQKGGETILISQAEVKNGAAPSKSSNGSMKKNEINKSLKRYQNKPNQHIYIYMDPKKT